MTMNENMKLWKYSGTFLVITGAIHTVYALLLGKEDFTDMIKDGLINSTDDSYSRAFALWFLVCGIILILWGLTLQYYIKKEQKPAPLIYHRADFRFLAVFAASISYNCCKQKKEHIIDNIMNTISVREQPQYTQQIIAYLQQVLSTWCNSYYRE